MKTLSVQEQAGKMTELMAQGMSLEEALRASLMRRLEIKTWTYQGDMHCPECGKYSKVSTQGRYTNQLLKLVCDKHGLFVKELGAVTWRRES
jgi:hypothetical protein